MCVSSLSMPHRLLYHRHLVQTSSTLTSILRQTLPWAPVSVLAPSSSLATTATVVPLKCQSHRVTPPFTTRHGAHPPENPPVLTAAVEICPPLSLSLLPVTDSSFSADSCPRPDRPGPVLLPADLCACYSSGLQSTSSHPHNSQPRFLPSTLCLLRKAFPNTLCRPRVLCFLVPLSAHCLASSCILVCHGLPSSVLTTSCPGTQPGSYLVLNQICFVTEFVNDWEAARRMPQTLPWLLAPLGSGCAPGQG